MMSTSVTGRGALIVIEGIDRVGKTTLCQRLVNQLISEGGSVEYMRFPARDTEIGKCIDKYLTGSTNITDQVIHLLFSANRWELNQIIKDKLLSGITLIVDRYAYSGVAYSAAKKTVSLDWCKAPDRGLTKPDKVIYLTADLQVLNSRPGFGDELYEKKEFQAKVKAMFDQLKEHDWKVIVADKEPEEVAKEALEEIKLTVNNTLDKEIGSLWTD